MCSIQQGEKDNSWSEQSPEQSTVLTVPFFLGHPVLCFYALLKKIKKKILVVLLVDHFIQYQFVLSFPKQISKLLR